MLRIFIEPPSKVPDIIEYSPLDDVETLLILVSTPEAPIVKAYSDANMVLGIQQVNDIVVKKKIINLTNGI